MSGKIFIKSTCNKPTIKNFFLFSGSNNKLQHNILEISISFIFGLYF